MVGVGAGVIVSVGAGVSDGADGLLDRGRTGEELALFVPPEGGTEDEPAPEPPPFEQADKVSKTRTTAINFLMVLIVSEGDEPEMTKSICIH